MNNQSWIRHFDSSNQESSLYNIGECNFLVKQDAPSINIGLLFSVLESHDSPAP